MAGVFLSTFETQGIALAEAWSMDVPAIVWDPQGQAEWRGRTFTSRSSAPFLTPATGVTLVRMTWVSIQRRCHNESHEREPGEEGSVTRVPQIELSVLNDAEHNAGNDGPPLDQCAVPKQRRRVHLRE